MSNSIQQQLNYLNSLQRFGIKPGLDTISKLLTALSSPHQQFKSIHVAGTNGKGSTANFIAHALKQSSLNTGLYTSPYIYSFNERIKINNSNISDSTLAQLIKQIRATAKTSNLQPTFFEFSTALAFLYFAEQKVDIAVVEVGMGGLLDATNVLEPLIAVITNISLDHTKYLGTTKQAIAKRKAGIIKKRATVVTAEKDPAILKLFSNICDKQHAKLYPLNKHLNIISQTQSLSGQTFKTSQPYQADFYIPLLGQHQITNACTALLALHLLNQQSGFNITCSNIKQGFKQAAWPGRLDVVSQKPFILADGAHNNDGAAALYNFLTSQNLPKPEVLILGAKKDKDISILVNKIAPLFHHTIITQGNYEPMPTRQIAQQIKQKNNTHEVPDIKKALEFGQKLLKPNHCMLITGSLYLIADALVVLRPSGNS